MRKGRAILIFSVITLFAGLLAGGLDSRICVAAKGFDREACIKECNNTFGGDDWEPPSLPPSSQNIYNRCLQNCERKAWKAFDREMDRDLK